MSAIHYKETRFGFQFGQADVSRVCSHNGTVIVRIASLATGKFVDVQLSQAGRKIHLDTGEYKSLSDVPGNQP